MSQPQASMIPASTESSQAQARPTVPAPEHHDQQAQTAIAPTPPVVGPAPHVPPAPHTPHPQVAAVGHGKPEAANGAHSPTLPSPMEKSIEENLAHYIAVHAAPIPQGAMVERVAISPSTPASLLHEHVQGLQDVGVVVSGVALEEREAFTHRIVQSLHRIPGFENAAIQSPFMSASKDGTHVNANIGIRLVGLGADKLKVLEALNSTSKGTPIQTPTHTCTGAGCAHHQPAEVAPAVATAPATPIAPPTAPAPEQKPVITAVAPEVTQGVTPTNTVEAPAQQLGRAAANDAHIQRAG